jgi:hypothetical protein
MQEPKLTALLAPALHDVQMKYTISCCCQTLPFFRFSWKDAAVNGQWFPLRWQFPADTEWININLYELIDIYNNKIGKELRFGFVDV